VSGGGRPLALTVGEPAGIGPDITIEAWLARDIADLPPFISVQIDQCGTRRPAELFREAIYQFEGSGCPEEDAIRSRASCAALQVDLRPRRGEGPNEQVGIAISIDVAPCGGVSLHPGQSFRQTRSDGVVDEGDALGSRSGVRRPAHRVTILTLRRNN
jgi:hypothetical protein